MFQKPDRREGSFADFARTRHLLLPLLALLLASCSTVPHIDKHAPPLVQASASLRYARRSTLPTTTRAALYLDAAALANAQMSPDTAAPKARAIYNCASAELTTLLREADGGRLWNRPLVLTEGGTHYQLHFAPRKHKGDWSPAYFTDFKLSRKINCKRLHHRFQENGLGGTLVGIHKTPTPFLGQHAPFEPKPGLVAPVTATLDFHGSDAALTLSDPATAKTVRLQGRDQPLAADFSAPIAFHPAGNELWQGLMGLMQVEKYMRHAGLYMIEPYDPNRIPVILVHGLISTPQMWVNVINELEADPQLRGRYQFWVYGYPTGNPPAYSALLCREELKKIEKLHPMPHGCIMVGHSMGGLVSRMQATTTGRVLWDANFGAKADRIYARLPASNPIKQALIFQADPHVKKVVFICAPHRGSEMALGSIGALGRKLITLPTSFVVTLQQSIMDVLQMPDGKMLIPNSITGLSPKSPTLIAMDKLPINAPYYSIIGDRGRGDTPNSSDGVVPYWSSHLANARTERIVPGPHGSYDRPETIETLKQILGEHLKTIQ